MNDHFIARLAAESEQGLELSKDGFLAGKSWIVGLVLVAVGMLLIYFGIKVRKGYRFFPGEDETQLVEDDLPTVNAEIRERRITEVPDYSDKGSGKLVFKEMLIRFEADGIAYEEWINDSGEYSDTVPVKYNPNNPQEFHIYEADSDFEGIPDENGDLSGNEDPEASDQDSGGSASLTLMGIGLIILAVGVFIFIDGI